MVEINALMVKELRERTGSGMMDCKNTLVETEGDVEKAIELLRKKGLAKAAKRSGRKTSEGVVYSYIHAGSKLGVLLEINCESDFVAKTDAFLEFAKNVAMHIAASNPIGISEEDISSDLIEKERDVYKALALKEGKPENIIEKIVDGKVQKYYKDVCLMKQQYIKDTQLSIADLLNEAVAKIGENIQIRRFSRFQIGE
jgi:elongation factor Ts